jgi:hypothetical protein
MEDKNYLNYGITYSNSHYDEFEKTGNQNIFEEIIDKMVLEGIPGMNESFIKAISKAPKDKKRMAILSLLDKDMNLFKSIKSLIKDNKISKIDHLKDVIYKIREYVKVGEVEQKKYGEVMSDLDKVVKPMLNEIEDDFWKNPNVKILDNCNGSGPFPLLAIWKFMSGLSDVEGFEDEEFRYKHIVENIIYVSELQPRNMFLWMCLVDPYDEYNLNLYTGSFLDDGFDRHMKEVWKVDNFQLILGNPPYQKMDGGGGKGSSAVPIYNLFIDKSLKICDKLLYITPSRWFSGGKGLEKFRESMLNNDYLKLIRHFPGNGTDIFGKNVIIKGGVSYFLIDKCEYSEYINFNNKMIYRDIIKKLGILLDDMNHYDILDIILKNGKSFFNSKVESRNFFGKNIEGYKTLQNGNDCIKDKISDRYLKCFLSKKEGYVGYVDISLVKEIGLEKYKIITTKGTNVGRLGNTFILNPGEICSETYLVILCDNIEIANNILKYFKTNFFKYLFKISNNTQNSSKSTYRFIPYFDFNYEWDDDKIFNFFKFKKEQIDFIIKY